VSFNTIGLEGSLYAKVSLSNIVFPGFAPLVRVIL
jgi:hypothetical protein